MEIQNLKSNINFNKLQKHKVIVSELKSRTTDANKESVYLDNVDMAPFQTTVTIRQDNIENLNQNVTDVEILPDEENWAENTTIVTGNTSERSESVEGVDHWSNHEELNNISYIHCTVRSFTSIIVICSFFSPIIMVILPKVGLFQDALSILTIQQKLNYSSCNMECKGYLLSLVFKVTLLGIGNWAIFLKQEAVIPRLFLLKAGVITLTTLCIFSYWLFYIVQITEGTKTLMIGDLTEYRSLVNYANNFVDTLLLIHFIAVLLIEVRHLRPTFYLKVVRSPDGMSRSYTIGQLSIQRAAIWVLEKYYTEFSIYNPYLERLPVPKSGKRLHSSNFKFYTVDNSMIKTHEQNSRSGTGSDRAILAAQARRRDTSHNERFYEEYDYERRVRKRKARLITAAEEAFAHLQRTNSDIASTANLLDPMEAAQAVFPSMARALQKFLRITRQQPRHPVDAILQRLAHCLAQDATPRAFLEPFFNAIPVLSNEKERQHNSQHWALICEGDLPSRSLRDGCEFQLRQGEIALLCSVHQLPHLHLIEQIALPKSNRFLLKLNSETSI